MPQWKVIVQVAIMESDRDPRAFLTDAERAAAAPYIDYPPTPKWYPPAVGAWAAAMVLALSALSDHPAVAGPILLVLVAGEGAFFAWYRRYRQTMPRLHGAPPEINGAFRRYAVGVIIVVAVCVAAFVLAGPILTAGVGFVTVTVGLALYERHYAAASDAAQRRLSGTG